MDTAAKRARKEARKCSRCRKPYYRGNRVRVWTKQAPGKRLGWERQDIKLCTGCMGEGQARQAARVVGARVVTINFRKLGKAS